jgi:hypothetical protein
MSLLRFLMMLSLAIWLGGIMFFAFVLAPTVFSVLPTRNLAGMVVSRSLARLHWIGLFSGIAYLLFSLVLSHLGGSFRPFAPRHLLVLLMIALVLLAQFGISGKMNRLRADMGVIDNVSQDDPRRLEFNRLHIWSTRTEGTILILGLAVLFLTTRRLS